MKRRLDRALPAAALALLLCAAPPALAIPPASEPVLEGIDVSVWQGGIDFAAVAADGIQVVYIRSSYGEKEDARFRANADRCLTQSPDGTVTFLRETRSFVMWWDTRR